MSQSRGKPATQFGSGGHEGREGGNAEVGEGRDDDDRRPRSFVQGHVLAGLESNRPAPMLSWILSARTPHREETASIPYASEKSSHYHLPRKHGTQD